MAIKVLKKCIGIVIVRAIDCYILSRTFCPCERTCIKRVSHSTRSGNKNCMLNTVPALPTCQAFRSLKTPRIFASFCSAIYFYFLLSYTSRIAYLCIVGQSFHWVYNDERCMTGVRMSFTGPYFILNGLFLFINCWKVSAYFKNLVIKIVRNLLTANLWCSKKGLWVSKPRWCYFCLFKMCYNVSNDFCFRKEIYSLKIKTRDNTSTAIKYSNIELEILSFNFVWYFK